MPQHEKPKLRHLHTEEKVEIIKKHAEGETHREIADELGISKSTSQCIVSSFEKEGKIHNAPRSGRPKKLSESDRRFVRLLATQEPHATIAEIAAASGLNVSDRLIGDTLRKGNLWVRVWRRKPWYTYKNRQQRKEFAHRQHS